MAIFHFHVTQIKRSKGHSAIASAAYRSGEKLYSEYYGETADYTRKGGVILSDILLPSYAPESFSDRQTLWNEVERAEQSKKAQLAYSFEISLQNEFTMEENMALAREFLESEFLSRGMIVDYSIHEPDREPGGIPNPHFHFACPIRPLKEDGTWGTKQHREYLLDEEGNSILDDAGNKKFNAVPTTDWGSPERLETWRASWAELCNAKFAEKGLDVRIDHRSYERQGLSQIPTVHEGPAVRQMEKRGIRTELGNLNRFIKATNQMMAKAVKRLAELREWIKQLTEVPPQVSTIADLLNQYFGERNAGAWSQKAKIHNLKNHAEILLFLQNRNITTVEDLKSVIDATWEASNALKTSMKAKTSRIKEIEELLRLVDYYKDNKPCADAVPKHGFLNARERYEKTHAEELKKFRMAQRKLKPYFNDDGKLPITKWNKELSQLQKDYQTDQAKYKTVYHDIHTLIQLRSCVEDATKDKDTQREDQRDKNVSL